MSRIENNSFTPNQADIEKWDSYQAQTQKSFFVFRATLLLIALIITLFLLFLEHFKPLNMLYIVGAFAIFSFLLFFNIKSLEKLMNKNSYDQLQSSKNPNGLTQCIFCGSSQLKYRVKGTRTTECRCENCKTPLFSHLDLSKEYRKNIDY